jgi:hypothetical protein
MTGRFVREAKRPTWKPSGQDRSVSAPFTAAAILCGLRNARWIEAHCGFANARVQEVRVPLERDERVGVPGDRLDAINPLHLHLEVERDGDPIEGRLIDQNGNSVSFAGWLELIAALEAARADTPERRPHGEEPVS